MTQTDIDQKLLEFNNQSIKPLNYSVIELWFKTNKQPYLDVYGYRLYESFQNEMSIKDISFYRIQGNQHYVRVFKIGKQGGISATSVPLTSVNLCLFFNKQDAQKYLDERADLSLLMSEKLKETAERNVDFLKSIHLP